MLNVVWAMMITRLRCLLASRNAGTNVSKRRQGRRERGGLGRRKLARAHFYLTDAAARRFATAGQTVVAWFTFACYASAGFKSHHSRRNQVQFGIQTVSRRSFHEIFLGLQLADAHYATF